MSTVTKQRVIRHTSRDGAGEGGICACWCPCQQGTCTRLWPWHNGDHLDQEFGSSFYSLFLMVRGPGILGDSTSKMPCPMGKLVDISWEFVSFQATSEAVVPTIVFIPRASDANDRCIMLQMAPERGITLLHTFYSKYFAHWKKLTSPSTRSISISPCGYIHSDWTIIKMSTVICERFFKSF